MGRHHFSARVCCQRSLHASSIVNNNNMYNVIIQTTCHERKMFRMTSMIMLANIQNLRNKNSFFINFINIVDLTVISPIVVSIKHVIYFLNSFLQYSSKIHRQVVKHLYTANKTLLIKWFGKGLSNGNIMCLLMFFNGIN